MIFGLEAMLFILLGLQLEAVVDDVGGRSAAIELLATGVALAGARDRRAGGLRAAADRPGPGPARAARGRLVRDARRDLARRGARRSPPTSRAAHEVIFLTFVVILVTLVGQGLTLPALVRRCGCPSEREWSPEEAIARLEAAQTRARPARRARGRAADRRGAAAAPARALPRPLPQCMAVIGGEKTPDVAAEQRMRYGDVRRDLIQAERAAVLGLRNEGKVSPGVQRVIERDLDLEEARLPLRSGRVVQRAPEVEAGAGAVRAPRLGDLGQRVRLRHRVEPVGAP